MVTLLFIITPLLWVGLIHSLYKINKLKKELVKQQVDFNKEKSSIRIDAKKRSGAVQWGLAIENFVPFIDTFPVPPEDTHHLGKPIDFLGFTDLDKPDSTAVHLIEVKSGTAFLNKHQKNIKKAVKEGRVEWHEVRVEANTVK